MRSARRAAFVFVVVAALAAFAAAAKPPAAGAAALFGAWEADSGDASLVVESATRIVFDGESYPYEWKPNVLIVDEDGDVVAYPYVLDGESLTVTYPAGETIQFHRAAGQPTETARRAVFKAASG
jgi:hypothetical protein